MTVPASAATWRTILDRLDASSPDSGRLARLASLAIRVEPRLLRRLRLRFLPGADASCEADLWFSALVAVRDTSAFSWVPGAAAVLRDALPDVGRVELAKVYAEIADVHASAPPLVKLEEEVAWLALCNAPRVEIERALGRAVRALHDQPARADDLAAWAAHALPSLPEAARGTAAAWQLRMAAASRFGTAPAMGVPAPSDLLQHVVRGVLVERGRERLRVVRDAERLWLKTAPDAADTDPDVMTVPSTRPLWVEVSSDQGRRRSVIAIEPERLSPLDAVSGDVLRNALGDAWAIESARGAQVGTDTDVGEVLFGWVIVRLPPEAPQGWSTVREHVLADLARSAGRVGRVDAIILLATDVLPEHRSALEAIGQELREVVGAYSSATQLLISPVPEHRVEGSGELPGNAQVVELTLAGRVRVVIRANDRPEASHTFSDRVIAAMQASDTKFVPGDLVFAVGHGAARISERRVPLSVPLLIVDGASPWSLPPGVRLASPPPLWGADNLPQFRRAMPRLRRASYALGCVRRVFPPTEGSPPAARLSSVERAWMNGEWRERTTRAPTFDLHYPGDRDFGWARNELAIVIGDPGCDGFIDALRAWWDSGGQLDPRSFIVVGSAGDTGPIDITAIDEEHLRAWLFVREHAALEHVDAVVRKLGTTSLVGFFDRRQLVPSELASGRRPLWVAAAPMEPANSSLPATSAGLEALLGAARSGGAVRLRDIQAHLTARLAHAPEIIDVPGSIRSLMTSSESGDTVAPAPKHVRIDTSAMRRIFGGDRRESPEITPKARVVFVIGRNAVSRSAWLDRWLRTWTEPAVNDDPRTVFGWTPWLQSYEALLDHMRLVLVDWSAPPSPVDVTEEIAWRIAGSNAVFVLDGLGFEVTDFERRLIDACARSRTGMLVVSTPHTPHIMGTMLDLPSTVIIDLDAHAVDHKVIRGTQFQPEVAGWTAGWIEQVATWGHDQPVLVAIDLARAAVQSAQMPQAPAEMLALSMWLAHGDPEKIYDMLPSEEEPRSGERIATMAIEAALALSNGDAEQMLARVRNVVELAVATLGAEECARLLGAHSFQPPASDGAKAGRRRALIVRPDYDSLAAFQNSASCIVQFLQARGFEIERCDGAAATRDGILGAYNGLIDRTRAEDAIVIYYIGHGGLTTNQTYTPDTDLPRYIQHICPTDFGETTDDDFRGISSFELSLQLAALTRKTKNVTVILDCSFAAQMVQMVRGDERLLASLSVEHEVGASPDAMQKNRVNPTDTEVGAVPVRPKLTRVGLTKHLMALRKRSPGFDSLAPGENSHAVRVAATGQTESAYSIQLPSASTLRAIGLDLPQGEWIGGMTFRLVEILSEIGNAHVPWRAIAAELRARMLVQRPEIEGPVSRVPFSLAIVEAVTFPVRSERDVAIIEAGRLLGVSVGDVYGVMPVGSTQIDSKKLIEEVMIDEVSAMQSRARRIAWSDGASELPANAVAIAVSRAFERFAVRVVAADTVRPAIETALQTSRRVRAATPQDRDVLAELRVEGQTLELHDAQGPLFPPAPYPDRLGDAVNDLENLATERYLRALPEDEGISPRAVSIELLVVGAGGSRRLADHGEALGLGDRIALRLENRTGKPMFANVFNIGLRRRIALLSMNASGGLKLLPHEPTYVGSSITGQLSGFTLRWPSGLPRDQPRLDTLMVVITQEPADLQVLEGGGLRARAFAPATPLQARLGQVATGRTRGPDEAHGVSAFAICWRDFRLFPLDGSLDFGAPQVEATPIGAVSPRAVAVPVQVRLQSLETAPGTRVDVLVCARAPGVPYRTTTVVDDVPSDLVVWRGELRGPADIYIWTSIASSDRRTLADLVAQRSITDPVAILRAPDGDPRAALAAGASMQLAAMVRTALLGIAPEVVTAFRGSFGGDDLGTQRYSAASASFTIAIEANSVRPGVHSPTSTVMSRQPILLARFSLGPTGKPYQKKLSSKGRPHYVLTLQVENCPLDIKRVTYELHPTFKRSVREVTQSPYFFERIWTYGDFLVRATLTGDSVHEPLSASLVSMLRTGHEQFMTSEINDAIEELGRN